MKKIFLAVLAAIVLLAGCAPEDGGDMPVLDPRNPVTITIWHYYNGAVLNAFEAAVSEFNNTVGMERGIIVEHMAFGSIGELNQVVSQSANQEIGSLPLPHIFAAFPDIAYLMQQLGLLANLDDYFTPEQQALYYAPFIQRGRIGAGGELRIFPVAKSFEVMMLNHTDWAPFAADTGVRYEDLRTMEGVARAAQIFYNWSGGRAFFGRDAFANLPVIGSKQFGVEIFEADRDGRISVNVDEQVMRRLWNYYYVPFISGYFAAFGRFRSDDLRVGDIIAYIGSTVSAAFFPDEVRADGETRAIEAKVLPAPLFEGGINTMVLQGAGMVVTRATPEEQYASLLFLKWFTEPRINMSFAALSGYLPVKIEAMDYALVRAAADEAGFIVSRVTDDAIRVALDEISGGAELSWTNAFDGAVEARAVLNTDLREKAIADRTAVLELIEGGTPRDHAIAQFASDQNFQVWLAGFTERVKQAAG